MTTPITDKMIEAGAEALCQFNTLGYLKWEDVPLKQKARYRGEAQAVLNAALNGLSPVCVR